jgi:HSP20 family protein
MATYATVLAPEKTTTPPVKMPAKHPSDLFRSLSQEMDRVFDDFGFTRRWPFLARTAVPEEALWSPAVEIEEGNGKLTVRADLPGMAKEDIKIELTNDALTIEGERKHTKEEKGEGFYRSECSYGHFYRSIVLPEEAKPETAKATFTNGVLQITVDVPPYKAPAGRRLTIDETPKA